jgi:hypothetical protein
MTSPIPLNLAVEDALTESLFAKILREIPVAYAIRTIYNRGGYGYLRQTINGFNNAAKGIPFLIGTDLDTYECPPALIVDWLQRPRHHNLLVRVAVREAEAWILADKQNFADFLGIRSALISDDVEAIPDPKRELIQLVRKARRRELREDICPPANSTRTVGPNYNSRLSAFVQQHWNPNTARERAKSLARTIDRLIAFQPQWPVTDNP